MLRNLAYIIALQAIQKKGVPHQERLSVAVDVFFLSI